MLESKNNKVSVLTKMIGMGDGRAPQLIVPQNSLSNLHARMGFSEKSINMASSNSQQATSIDCPHCQNMAKNFLYLESLLRANSSPKSKCSLCCSTLRYVEYVNKSILDVFAKNKSIIDAALKYSATKPRFHVSKLVGRGSRLTAGGKKTTLAANKDNADTISVGSGKQRTSKKSKNKSKPLEVATPKWKNTPTTTVTNKKAKTKAPVEKTKKEAKTKLTPKNNKPGSKSSLKTSKAMRSRLSTRSATGIPEHGSRIKKMKATKIKKSASATPVLKKHSTKTKRKLSTGTLPATAA